MGTVAKASVLPGQTSSTAASCSWIVQTFLDWPWVPKAPNFAADCSLAASDNSLTYASPPCNAMNAAQRPA